MPLLETTDGHWSLLVADLCKSSFLLYDSLPSPVVKSKRELLDSVRIALVLAFLRSTTYANVGQWEVVTPKCPEQKNGHGCGVFIMAFMDLLSLKADGFEFDQDCAAHYRDKCLLSFIQGQVAHFPQHLRLPRIGLDVEVALYIIIYPWLLLMYILGYAIYFVGLMRNCIVFCILCIKHILTYPYGDPGFDSCVSGDKDILALSFALCTTPDAK
ncbi:hypothetical protein Cgig2_000657 [Carnegiea gigantea]|uniref:Ubiquitin-like protease family profile domain-containing protein n=1 Tax=Carnegiea gigantea TaxID=171969 RepID=A0A9Q1GIV9_9CARY|nr:hypothetical protein Cgig2_000657 [Carnegiea gigantea]